MKQLTGNQVRQMFLDYFESKGHMIEPGASLVPINDPSLLWINAGVAALKKYFDGREKPRCNRICNAQKSIRTNDIENVGKTARHHTFFEMLGNFSIGDYFKEDALKFAYEFLTSPEWIGFDPNRLYVTVYSDDTEAYRIWTEVIGFDPTHCLCHGVGRLAVVMEAFQSLLDFLCQCIMLLTAGGKTLQHLGGRNVGHHIVNGGNPHVYPRIALP